MQIKAQIKQGTDYFVVRRNILFVNWVFDWDFNWRFTEGEVPHALEGERLSAMRAI